jgi:hypothetical protein
MIDRKTGEDLAFRALTKAGLMNFDLRAKLLGESSQSITQKEQSLIRQSLNKLEFETEDRQEAILCRALLQATEDFDYLIGE